MQAKVREREILYRLSSSSSIWKEPRINRRSTMINMTSRSVHETRCKNIVEEDKEYTCRKMCKPAM